jgi:ubiquitin carboxyl-terminal hydrolase 34
MDDCVRNLDRLTAPVIAEDSEFWNHLPLLVDTLLRRQYVSLLDRCSLFRANFDLRQELLIEQGPAVLTGLEEFFMDYVQIALHMVRLDIMSLRLLAEEPETKLPDGSTQRWLQFLAWVLTFKNIPFYRALEAVHDTDAYDLVRRIRAKTFAPPIDAPAVLAEYTSLLLEIMPKAPALSNIPVSILLVANSITDCTLEKMQNEQDSKSEFATDLSTCSHFLTAIYDTVRQIDGKYQHWVTKKSPLISGDISEHMMRQIPHIYKSLCQSDPTFMEQVAKDLGIELPDDVSTESMTEIIYWGWKVGVLKRHIMEGRMELRVHGVETMQSDLVTVWKQRISNNAAGVNSPDIQYLVRFIQSNKIVDYLVGVDSHPQLISRSSNIVGFLIVTGTYTNLETDVIWKAVTESQDSRIVSEVLAMLTRTFYMHPTASSALLYICSKVLELPLERFDARMLEFCEYLLSRMSETPNDHAYYGQHGVDHVNAVPLWLCVRLIRESTAADNLSYEQRTQLQNFGSKQLATFIRAGISEGDRTEIYERCIQDIAEMNEFTAGSIQALNALVPMYDAQEINKLAIEYDLTRLVITDLLHTVNGDHVDLSDAFAQHGLVSRVTILFRLVDIAPETITPELGQAFWNDILLSSKLGLDGHKTVWNMMVAALTRCSKPNPFLDRCIHEYLPSLVPKDYSPDLLAFTKMSITYEVRFNPPPAAGANEVVTIPGMDRIWNFILTSPPGSIEVEATDYAIKTYLDHPVIKSSPRSAIEATHVAIADRCIDQLKSSGAALKPSDSAAINGTTAMETENTDGAMGSEELRFRRSLQFLYRLLHGLRARPQYVSPRGSPPSLPERPLKGEPIDLSWQWFNGNTSSGVKSLRIGDLSTAAELVEILSRLSGFSKFSAICGGQRLDLLDDPEALVKDIKVLHSGLLILRKAPDAQEVSRDSGRHSLTSVDSEVMKHFDEIYGFLALKENVAREVGSIITPWLFDGC